MAESEDAERSLLSTLAEAIAITFKLIPRQ